MSRPGAALLIHSAVILFFAAAILLAPIAIDRIQMDDTVLLAQIGWRGVNGLSPVIDYPHFYGGFAEFFVIASFKLFGVSFKSIDVAFFALFVVSAGMTWALCFRRVTATQMGFLVALAAALILSLNPVEMPGFHGTGHSFVYNHVGIVLMLALTVFTSVALEDRRAEWISAIAAGSVLYLLIIVKTTFGVIGPAVLLGCLIQRRWTSAGLVLFGATAAMVLFDPGMTRALGSLHVLLTSQAANQAGGFAGRMREALAMMHAQALPVFLCLILSILLVRRSGRWNDPLLLSLFFCGLGYSAAMLTTGGVPSHKMLPFLIVASMLLSQALLHSPLPSSVGARYSLLIQRIPVILAYSLIVPGMVTAGQGLWDAVRNVDAALVAEGPLSRYVVVNGAFAYQGRDNAPLADRLAAATQATLTHIQSRELLERDEYVMFADGVNLLRRVPDVSHYGIISNGRMFDFTAPLKSRIVPSYPVWPTISSVQSAQPLGRDVDLVMLLDELPELDLVTGALRARMRQEFRPCHRSAFWTLYVRRTSPVDLCATPAPEATAPPTSSRAPGG